MVKLLRAMTLAKLHRAMTLAKLLRVMAATQQCLRDTTLIFRTTDTIHTQMNLEDLRLRLILRLMAAMAVLTTLLLTLLMMLFRVIPHRPVLRLVPTIAHHRLMAAAEAVDNTHLIPVAVAATPVTTAPVTTAPKMMAPATAVGEPLEAL